MHESTNAPPFVENGGPLPVSSCIIDGELVAADASGEPDFRALLHGRTRGACVYAFDLMEWRGRDIREQPLVQRRAQLEATSQTCWVRVQDAQ